MPIYRELNRMLDRVEGVLERERAFVDAAAHELRTPLAELRSAAEVAIRWPEPARASAVLHEVLAIGGEMERLVESLLLISRGDAGGEEPLTSPTVPADTIVPACLDRCNGAISDKAIRLSVQLEEGRSPRAPRDALTIIVRNLVDNAVQYTPVHGRIAIRSEPDSGGSSTFVVENGPVELEAGDLPRLFEPFWRTDTARSDRDHLGLGLAIVQRVAEAVGLRVDARLAGDRLQLRLSSESAKRCAS
ncbi:MAG: sensor histidine kinase [Planctomycetota bacterium]